VSAALLAAGCDASAQTAPQGQPTDQGNLAVKSEPDKSSPPPALATFGAGCFWCVEAVFQEVKGVISVKSGYSGGHTENPSYEDVCTGLTGHAEVCQINFDPQQIRYEELLEIFWKTHDPTTLNRQGADEGTQYRSVIFFHNADQERLAKEYRTKLNQSGAWDAPIVTEVAAFTKFYPAEKKHDDFYRQNPNYGYCRWVIQPKMDKFRKAFHDKLKSDQD
jgi:peptide-methionine (S)-S-oxide reductase